MADKIVFLFERDGQSVLLDDTQFSVSDYSGIEASDYNLITEDNVNADGARLQRRQVLPREIMVDFDYLLWREVVEMRQYLIGFFSPYSSGKLTVNYIGVQREIEYEVSKFKMNNTNVHDELSCLLYVHCLDPSFKGALVSEPITTLVGGWNWMFKLPFRLKQYGELRKTIRNNGHMATPLEIFFRGPAEAPVLRNLTTGEALRVNRNLTVEETLYVNTAFRKKKVEIIHADGTREDAWNALGDDTGETDFFWLEKGDNVIEYSAGSLRSVGVSIQYQERYLGV